MASWVEAAWHAAVSWVQVRCMVPLNCLCYQAGGAMAQWPQRKVDMLHASPAEPQVHGGATNPRWLAATASTVSHSSQPAV